jgi:hypothetical protein
MGGRRIDDHAFWAGPHGKGTVMPDGAKTKQVSSAEGDGAVHQYEDTNDRIVRQQHEGVKHARGHATKPGYRY